MTTHGAKLVRTEHLNALFLITQSVFKGLVHQKKKRKFCQYLLTLMLFQTSMCWFVLLNTKEDIWKNVLIKQISFPIDYHRKKYVLW